jgi:hypothetical protein
MPQRLLALAKAVLAYLAGFLALAVFAAVAYGGGAPSEARWLLAFKLGGALALGELVFLLGLRRAPANRLIVGANLWLVAGGLAAFTGQWWWLRGYQHLGEAGLFVAMALVGLVSLWRSPAGFVAVSGDPRRVARASWLLLGAVGLALGAAVWFRGQVQWAAVVPVIALSWLARGLRLWVVRAPAVPGR